MKGAQGYVYIASSVRQLRMPCPFLFCAKLRNETVKSHQVYCLPWPLSSIDPDSSYVRCLWSGFMSVYCIFGFVACKQE